MLQTPAVRTLPAELHQLLPAAPAHLLLVGELAKGYIGPCMALGYHVTHCPFNTQSAIAQYPSATRDGICQVDLALPAAAASSFSMAVVTDISPRVHPLALWDQLAHGLADGAMVVLTGAPIHEHPPRMQNWLRYVVAIGARCGFAEQESTAELTNGRDGAFTRLFRKTTRPRWQIRHVRPVDFEEIATLFHEVFGQTLSSDLWSWKYADGRGNAVVAARNGALIAHYGGMYRDVMLCGEPDWVFQICDVMVHPNERGVMTRQGPFLLTAATSAEIYGPLGFGFPNARAMLVAAKMGLYSEVGQLAEVRWEPAPSRIRMLSRVKVLHPDGDGCQSIVDTLWESMAHDLRGAVVGVRNWAYLNHRYFGHPHHQYDVLAVTSRLAGKPLGVLVLRKTEASCELMDVIAPLAHLPLLLDQARRLTALWQLPYLYCWITKNYLPLFMACAGTEEALNVTIPTSCWTDDARAQVFKDRWWLMSGDTDFH
jgi:hypothetical protein